MKNKFDVFITDIQLSQYTTPKQKEIAKLFEKVIFKILTTKDILSNTQIFNFCFTDKIKNLNINKAFAKCWLIIQTYHDKKKDLVQTQLSSI